MGPDRRGNIAHAQALPCRTARRRPEGAGWDRPLCHRYRPPADGHRPSERHRREAAGGESAGRGPYYIEDSGQYLIALRSSSNFKWPWSEREHDAEQVFRETYPAVFEHLNQFREAAIKRTDQGEFWWELRSCDYWEIGRAS